MLNFYEFVRITYSMFWFPVTIVQLGAFAYIIMASLALYMYSLRKRVVIAVISGIFTVGAINSIVMFGLYNTYKIDYTTCNTPEAEAAGYKYLDNKCYRPYNGYIGVTSNTMIEE